MSGTVLLNVPAADRVIVRMCCHCRRIRTASGWQHEPMPAGLPVSHGICRECYVVNYPEYPIPETGD